MKAIILAAGMSKRLRPVTNKIPKCLLKLDERTTILGYQINSLIKCGIEDIIVVVGYMKNLVLNYLYQQHYYNYTEVVYNKLFSETDNAYSLSLALDRVNDRKESVIVLDGDIIFDIELIKNLLSSKDRNIIVANNDKKIDNEDSKVAIKDGYVVGIGKEIKGDTVYTSIIKLGGEFLSAFKEKLKEPRTKLEWYSGPLNRLLELYPKEVSVSFTNGIDVSEVDTIEDLIHAREIYRRLREKYKLR